MKPNSNALAHIGTDIQEAAAHLRAGALVAIPTETVYGLAGNGCNGDAVAAIFLTKNRPQFNPLILHVADLEAAAALTQGWPPLATTLAKAFWPGPLTLLLPRNENVPDIVTAGSPLVAVRIPQHPLTLKLLHAIDFPLAAPSANPSGYISPTQAQHVDAQLGDRIPYILDGGETTVGIESTIIGFDDAENPLLYRKGGLALDKIEAITGPLRPAQTADHKPETPGQLAKHYAPQTLLLATSNIHKLRVQYAHKKIGILAFRAPQPDVPAEHQIVLSPQGNTAEAAQKLFAAMRHLDALELDLILAEYAPENGLGPAINDRLDRASYDGRKAME